MNKQQNTKQQTIGYNGIFFSCLLDHGGKCIHASPEHFLTYLFSGELVIEDRNQHVVANAGECVFVRRNHRLEMYKNSKYDEPYKGISLTFNRSLLRDFFGNFKKNKLPKKVRISDENVFKIDGRPDVASLFQSLVPYFDENVSPTNEVTDLKLQEGIHAVLNSSDIFYPIMFDFIEPWKIDILEFLNNNYMDELTMEEIANYTGRSLATFKRDFKKISDLTPQKWLIKKRLEVAYVKLKEGGKIKDVYMEVGFKNPSHFSTAFKQQYGVPPAEIVSG